MGANSSSARMLHRQTLSVQYTLRRATGQTVTTEPLHYLETAEIPAKIRKRCVSLAHEQEPTVGYSEDEERRRIVVRRIVAVSAASGRTDGSVNYVERPELWWDTFRSPSLARALLMEAEVLQAPAITPPPPTLAPLAAATAGAGSDGCRRREMMIPPPLLLPQ